jgi:hypothetical protein
VYKLGIIPAAGKATRFGGYLKELLPLPNGYSFLREAVNRLRPYTSEIVLVTSQEKIDRHVEELGGDVIYFIQRYAGDIYGAIRTACDIPADYYFFTMPDTYLDRATFCNYNHCDFALGMFETDKPERFGCLVDGQIINKTPGLQAPLQAWGALAWSSGVVKFWDGTNQIDYTTAINAAMNRFGYSTWKIDNYFDNASIVDYGSLWR